MLVMAKKPQPLTPERIRTIRKAAELTQAEAAEKVGVTQGVWSDWERGTKRPSRQSQLLIRMLSEKIL